MNHNVLALCLAVTGLALPACAEAPAPTSQPAPASAPLAGIGAVVSKSGVYLRTGADMADSAVMKLEKGHAIRVTGWSGQYWAVQPPEGCRFVIAKKAVQVDGTGKSATVQSPEASIHAVLEKLVSSPQSAKTSSGQVRKGAVLHASGELDAEWLVVTPPSHITLFISMDCVAGEPMREPASWDTLGEETPEKLLGRIAAAVRGGNDKKFIACLDPAGILNADVGRSMLRNTQGLLALQEKAVGTLGNDEKWDLRDGLLGMLTMVHIRWFDKATIAVTGDTAKASHETVDKDGARSRNSVSLVRRNGRWFLGGAEQPDQLKAAQTVVVMRRVGSIISDAQKKVAEDGMTMEKLHLWCRDRLWESLKSGDFVSEAADE